MNILKKISLPVSLVVLLLSTTASAGPTKELCTIASFRSKLVFSAVHILKNNPDKKEILNSEKRKELILEKFAESIDPYSIYTTAEEYTSFENSIIQYNPTSNDFCSLLEYYLDTANANKKNIFTILNSEKNIDNQILKIKETLEEDPKLVKERWAKINENRTTNFDDALWVINRAIASDFIISKSFNETDINSYKAALRGVNESLNKEVNYDDLLSALINSYLQSVDIHTNHYSKNKSYRFMQQSQNAYKGIGVSLYYAHNGIRIAKISPGGPADKNKILKAGDIIVSVNGDTEVTTKSTQDMVNKIKQSDDIVKLGIERDGKNIGIVEIKLGSVPTKKESVTSEITTNNLAYLRLDSFFSPSSRNSDDGAAGAIKAELNKKTVQASDALIIDLRSNGGGSVAEVLSILGFFIGKTEVMTQMDADQNIHIDSTDTDILYKKPIIVMVNEYSASASEILAGNLKAFNRALVVGSDTTFGKGIVQAVMTMPENEILKVTTDSYHLADGVSPQFIGVGSDIVLPRPDTDKDIRSERTLNPVIKEMPLSTVLINDSDKWLTDSQKEQIIESLNIPLVEVTEEAQDIEKEQALGLLEQYLSALKKSAITIKKAN